MKSKIYIRLILVFTTLFVFTLMATSQNTTISVQVSDSGDDVEEVAEEGASDPVGTVDMTSSDLEFIEDDGFLQMVGMIFRNVELPPNANIVSAYIQFFSDKALDGTPVTCQLFGGSVANITAPFTETLMSVSSHAQTVATVKWTVPPFGDPGTATEAERSPDISSIIQEIVGLGGWASGNNLMIGVKNDGDTKAANREAVSFDGQNDQAPILNVTYNTNPIGIEPGNREFSCSVYPNPAEARLTIVNPSSGSFSYEIFNISGQLVAVRYDLTGPTTDLDMSEFARGIYFVDVKTAERTETHKLILE